MSRRRLRLPPRCAETVRVGVRSLFGQTPRVGRALPLYQLAPGARINERSLQRAHLFGWACGFWVPKTGRAVAEIYYIRGQHQLASISYGKNGSSLVQVLTGRRLSATYGNRLLIVPCLDLLALWHPKPGKDLLTPLPLVEEKRARYQARWVELLPDLRKVVEIRTLNDDRPRRFRSAVSRRPRSWPRLKQIVNAG
jgi:hypothetical protein